MKQPDYFNLKNGDVVIITSGHYKKEYNPGVVSKVSIFEKKMKHT